MEKLRDDALAVIDTLDLKRYYVGGHSLGGMLTISIAGARPRQVAGAIPMEGWTYHLVEKEAFGGRPAPPLTPGEEKERLAARERGMRQFTEEKRKEFGAVWRQWDGTSILATTLVPFLSIWGDRGHPRPSRQLLRLPDRPNLEIAWMAGSTHSLLIQRPVEVATATAAFIDRQERSMLIGASPANDLPGELVTIYRAEEGTTGFNMHPYVTWFDGKFWAMWSCNRIRDLQSGQYVRFATSQDGVRWSPSQPIMPGENGYRYFARGFWVRDGRLIALAARDEAVRPLFGPGLELRGYQWTGSDFAKPEQIAADTINNFPPERLTTGQWMMARRDHKMTSSMLLGDKGIWETAAIPAAENGAKLDEPVWWRAASGALVAAFRDGSKSHRLYRAFSTDEGKTWSQPLRTDFPDAEAKFNVVRVSDGRYAMAHNPNENGKRIPMSLSISDDGIHFHRVGDLRSAETIYRYQGKDLGYAGYHYPQLLEHNGYLYVIHSENMEDIRLIRLKLPLSTNR